MDVGFWQKEWDAVMAAPVLFIIAAVIVVFGVWWLRGRIDDGEIRGFRAHLNAANERLAHNKDLLLSAEVEAKKISGELETIRRLSAPATREAVYPREMISTHSATASTSMATLGNIHQQLRVLSGPVGPVGPERRPIVIPRYSGPSEPPEKK